MKLGLAPATSIIFKKESLWIGSELRWNLIKLRDPLGDVVEFFHLVRQDLGSDISN